MTGERGLINRGLTNGGLVNGGPVNRGLVNGGLVNSGLVNRVLDFSLVDGPGNRLVIFVQGCNFDCIACHNPYTIDVCDSCGGCVEPCPDEALSLTFDRGTPEVVVDRNVCTECDVCIEVCPINSTPLARRMEVSALLQRIGSVAPFISGITVSGGEATRQADFVVDLFSAVKSTPGLDRLTTMVDTNGSADRATWDRLAPVMDGAMVDLKALDPELHLRMTGQDNAPVLESIRHLAAIGKLYEVRLLMVPGHNDSAETVKRTAEWLLAVDPDMRVKLIGFRRHGVRPHHAHIAEAEPEHLAILERTLRAVGLSGVVVV
ncbi:MAG TPA: YjjW family glycine radical enzyme activase [Acidimicrobiales bacterium]|nr:YjjW family glycine radical enzyme activase [Acidimicrobiales bacterium]